MPNQYIEPVDYQTFDLPNDTTEQQVILASLQIDALLNKPAGLLYEVDALGNAVYMTGLTSTSAVISTAPISPGTNVVVPVNGPLTTLASGRTYGQPVVIDKDNDSTREVCIIKSIDTVNRTVTLSSVLYAHNTESVMALGLTIFEDKKSLGSTDITSLSYTPVARVVGAQGYFTQPRRSDLWQYNYFTDYSPFTIFGQGINGEPIYQAYDVNNIVFNSDGSLQLPANLYSGFYNAAAIYYLAGWTYESLPTAIKKACALIINLGIVGSTSGSTSIISGPLIERKAGVSDLKFVNLTTSANSNFVDFTAPNIIMNLLNDYRRIVI